MSKPAKKSTKSSHGSKGQGSSSSSKHPSASNPSQPAMMPPQFYPQGYYPPGYQQLPPQYYYPPQQPPPGFAPQPYPGQFPPQMPPYPYPQPIQQPEPAPKSKKESSHKSKEKKAQTFSPPPQPQFAQNPNQMPYYPQQYMMYPQPYPPGYGVQPPPQQYAQEAPVPRPAPPEVQSSSSHKKNRDGKAPLAQQPYPDNSHQPPKTPQPFRPQNFDGQPGYPGMPSQIPNFQQPPPQEVKSRSVMLSQPIPFVEKASEPKKEKHPKKTKHHESKTAKDKNPESVEANPFQPPLPNALPVQQVENPFFPSLPDTTFSTKETTSQGQPAVFSNQPAFNVPPPKAPYPIEAQVPLPQASPINPPSAPQNLFQPPFSESSSGPSNEFEEVEKIDKDSSSYNAENISPPVVEQTVPIDPPIQPEVIPEPPMKDQRQLFLEAKEQTNNDFEIHKEALLLLNKFRIDNGKSAVKYNKKISTIVYPHAAQLSTHSVQFEKEGYDARVKKVKKALGGNFFAENVGNCTIDNQKPIDSMFNQWSQLPQCRDTMLGNFQQVGFAFVITEGQCYGVQFFKGE